MFSAARIAAILAWSVVTIDFGAAIGYTIAGDYKKGILWACWGLGTMMVTI